MWILRFPASLSRKWQLFKEVFEIKTLIELFDTCQIENVIAGLRFVPEKIVFVGFKGVMTKKRTRDMEAFFKMKGISIAFEYEIVGRYDFDFIVDKLNYILDNNEDCCFDLTGGKELVLTAMGAVSAERNIPMLQFNVRSGNLIRVKNCENIAEPEKVPMTISESVVLNGGAIVTDEEDDFPWDLNEDFKKDIEKMWRICKGHCGLWNWQSNMFKSFEDMGEIDENLRVNVDLSKVKKAETDIVLNERVVSGLRQSQLILEYELKGDSLSFKYKNEQVRQCITKAGNILELYAYMLAREINEEEPEYYDDIDIGVYVDWDGVIHDEDSIEIDTRNEVDVMLMRDLVPVFISCKNGEVRKEALYELDTVAKRFGGEYSKKVLLTTYRIAETESGAYIKRRAMDMGIDIIYGVEKLDREKFKDVLKSRIK